MLEQLDSKIWIESSKEKSSLADENRKGPYGTEIVFTFKLFNQSDLKMTQTKTPNKESKKILVAEDQIIYRETLKQLLITEANINEADLFFVEDG